MVGWIFSPNLFKVQTRESGGRFFEKRNGPLTRDDDVDKGSEERDLVVVAQLYAVVFVTFIDQILTKLQPQKQHF